MHVALASPDRPQDLRRRLARVAVALLIVVGSLAGATSVRADDTTPPDEPTPPPPGPTILGESVTFFGRGYGHGVGMSQYGARGRALDGQDAATILAHYYPGTKAGTLDQAPTIRVLVLSKYKATKAKPLVIYGRSADWSIKGIATVFPPDAKLTLTPKVAKSVATWRLRVWSAAGVLLLDRKKVKAFTLLGATSSSQFQVWSKPGSYDQYRGKLRVRPSATSAAVSVVDHVSLELYLRGVVPAEMPASWPAEALKAQAVAARSYAARKLRPGVSYFDVYDDTRSQVYRGAKGEKAATTAAIKATAGQVLRKGKAIANTMFHSTGGGATENNENVYTSATGKRTAGVVSYLRGSLDRREDGSAYDRAAPYATWAMVPYTRAQLSAWFAADPRTAVGDLTALDLRDRGVSGRLVSVTLIGSAGKKKVSGSVFRSVLNAARPAADPMLRSTLFDTQPIP